MKRIVFCFVALAALAICNPADAGFGFVGRSRVVTRSVVRAPVVRQRVVVQQQLVAPAVYSSAVIAAPVYAAPVYAAPAAVVAPSCGGAAIQSGCNSFFSR